MCVVEKYTTNGIYISNIPTRDSVLGGHNLLARTNQMCWAKGDTKTETERD